MDSTNVTNCTEQCGNYENNKTINDNIVSQFDQFGITNLSGNNFAYDEVIKINPSADIKKVFEQTSYKYVIEASIDTVINKLFYDIKMNKTLMSNMSTEIIYLLNRSTGSIKQLGEQIYMLYICKFLSYSGAKRCSLVNKFKYQNILFINNENFIKSIDDGIRQSEIVDAYIGFNTDILVKRYYNYLIEEINKIEDSLISNKYLNPDSFISNLQFIITNMITANVQFIIELNNFFYGKNIPIFYINDRMLSFYYGELQLNYISWYLNYISPSSKQSKIQNLLDKSLSHYYDNIKERVCIQTNFEVELIDI